MNLPCLSLLNSGQLILAAPNHTELPGFLSKAPDMLEQRQLFPGLQKLEANVRFYPTFLQLLPQMPSQRVLLLLRSVQEMPLALQLLCGNSGRKDHWSELPSRLFVKI